MEKTLTILFVERISSLPDVFLAVFDQIDNR